MLRKKREFELEERRKKVAANLKAGLNYRDIAEALHVSIGTVSNDVKILTSRWKREQIDTVEDWIALQVKRIDVALNAIWGDVNDGNTRSIETMIKLEERRSKLIGLDAPEKMNSTNLNIDISELTDEQLERIANGEPVARVIADSRKG